MKFALIAAIILASLMTLFAVQNSQHTQVTFLSWYFDGPLVIVLLISYATGALSAFLSMIPGSVRKSLEITRLKSALLQNSAVEPEISSTDTNTDARSMKPGGSHENQDLSK